MAGPTSGDPAPPFELPNADGELVSLADFEGQSLVLYFYPSDFTPGCTREACSFRDARQEFQQAGAAVVGISKDDPGTHAKFKGKYELDFPLLSDVDGLVHEAYGATGLLGRRTTFVIDQDGRIVERIRSPLPGPHVRKALDQVNEA